MKNRGCDVLGEKMHEFFTHVAFMLASLAVSITNPRGAVRFTVAAESTKGSSRVKGRFRIVLFAKTAGTSAREARTYPLAGGQERVFPVETMKSGLSSPF